MPSAGPARKRRRQVRSIGWAASAAVALMIASSCALDLSPGENRVAPAPSSAPPSADGEFHAQGVGMNGAPLILDEEFNGTGLNHGVWNTCHWWDDGGCTIASNDELQWYLPGQVAVHDGNLRLTAERRDVTGGGEWFPYVSGMVSTGPPRHDAEPKLAFTYGTVEVRFSAPRGAGAWPAIWMLPASEESTPEIDLVEAVGQQPRRSEMFFHPSEDSGLERVRSHVALPAENDLANPHTVRLQWSPDRLDFFFDGRKVWEVTGGQVPDEPMYLVINLAVGGVKGGPPDPSAFPATFHIDYARIWSEGPT